MIRAQIGPVAYHLPAKEITNADLAAAFPEWSIDKIEAKTGIRSRFVAAPGECASDLGVAAAERLFAGGVDRAEIDYLIFCTQSPDYFLPATACLVQHRLKLRTGIGAIDVNQGCSGFVYGLSLAKGLVESGQARTVLLITAETYSKFMHEGDKSVRTLFGDAGAAMIVNGVESPEECIGPFIFGTDGAGAGKLIVPFGGLRNRPGTAALPEERDASGNVRTAAHLYMDGPGVFEFTLKTVPASVRQLLELSGTELGAVDHFVFHQASKFMMDSLRKKLAIPESRFVEHYGGIGNTVSCTIPIALCEAGRAGRFRRGERIMLVGFGVGLSWSACMVRWR